MVLLPCSKCCGPCWRCYRKPELEVCESQEITATLEVVSVSGFNGVEIDTSEETGMPVGTKLKLESAQPLSSSLCEFYFTYTSPTTGPCGPPFTGATNVGVYANLSGNQLASNQVYGRGGDAIFLGDQQLSCGGIPTGRGGGGPWDNAVWDGFGKHQFTVPVVDLDTYSVQIGEIVYEINVIDLSAEDPDIPEDLYEYKCFDAPPTEEGWEPVGKCHPTEEECAEECPPRKFFCYTDGTDFGCYKEDDQPDGWTVSSGPYETSEECDEICGKYFCWINEGGTDFQCVQSKENGPDGYELFGGPYDTQLECEDNCGYWQCYTDGTDTQCVKFDETPPAGWETDGIKHSSKLQCETFCGKYLCVTNEDRSDFQCLPPGTPVPDGYQTISVHETEDECNDRCDSFSCWKLQPPIPCRTVGDCACDPPVEYNETCSHSFIVNNVRFNGSAVVGGGPDRPPEQSDEVLGYVNNLNLTGHKPGGTFASCNSGYVVLPNLDCYGRPNGTPGIYGHSFSEYGIGLSIVGRPTNQASGITFGNFYNSGRAFQITGPWIKDDSWRPGYLRRFVFSGGQQQLAFECEKLPPAPDPCDAVERVLNMQMSRDEIGSRYNTFGMLVEWQIPGQSCNQSAGFAQYFFDGVYTLQFGKSIVTPDIGKCTLADGSCVDATQKECEEELCGYWSPGPDCNPYKPSKYCLNFDPSNDGNNLDWILEKDGMTYEECQAECSNTRKAKTMPTTKTTGPGTELANILKILGIDAREKGCSCRSHAKKMDREGPQWCRDNIETILGWLEKEAKKRKLPFIKTAAKQVVLLAIRRAEKRS